MSGWSGSGTFSRTYNWTQDQSNGILIDADRHDANDTDFVNGINNCVTKDGQNTPSADLPMAAFKHTGVGNATARNHYAAAGQIQDQSFVWCGTAGGTANALTLAPSPSITAYAAGQSFVFKAGANANTGATTVAISGLTTIAVQFGGAALVSGEIEANKFYRITLDTTSTAQLEPFSQSSFSDVITVRGVAANAGRIRLGEDADNGTNYAEIIAPASLGSNVVLTAPSSTGILALTSDIPSVPAVVNSRKSTADYSGTTSATAVMMGLNFTLTPLSSGKVQVTVTGNITNVASTLQLAYGTGTPPVNGAAASGTATGTIMSFSAATGNSVHNWSLSDVIDGLTPSTAYWFDVRMTVSSGTLTPTSVTANAFEL
jgi:hypothetical protein